MIARGSRTEHQVQFAWRCYPARTGSKLVLAHHPPLFVEPPNTHTGEPNNPLFPPHTENRHTFIFSLIRSHTPRKTGTPSRVYTPQMSFLCSVLSLVWVTFFGLGMSGKGGWLTTFGFRFIIRRMERIVRLAIYQSRLEQPSESLWGRITYIMHIQYGILGFVIFRINLFINLSDTYK